MPKSFTRALASIFFKYEEDEKNDLMERFPPSETSYDEWMTEALDHDYYDLLLAYCKGDEGEAYRSLQTLWQEGNELITIYVLGNGEEWDMGGENRRATEQDAIKYAEYGVKVGDKITVLDNGDMEVGGDSLFFMEITQREMDEMDCPRKLDGYYHRIQIAYCRCD